MLFIISGERVLSAAAQEILRDNKRRPVLRSHHTRRHRHGGQEVHRRVHQVPQQLPQQTRSEQPATQQGHLGAGTEMGGQPGQQEPVRPLPRRGAASQGRAHGREHRHEVDIRRGGFHRWVCLVLLNMTQENEMK